MSSLGYSGEISDFYCVNPHASRASFVLHSSNPSMLRPVFPQPIPVHSSHSSLEISQPSQLQCAGEGISKPMFDTGFDSKTHHLSVTALQSSNKTVAPCLAASGHVTTTGHMTTTHHMPRASQVKDKLTPRQIDSLVSDIFNSDLQYHDSSDLQHQQAVEKVAVPAPCETHPTGRKRIRKKKEPQQRKIKPAGTHIPREEIKKRRCRGDEYITRTGKLVGKKVFQMIDCKCRRNCTTKVPREVRKRIFEEYHAMADWNSQTQFIVASVVVTDVKRKRLRKVPGEENSDHVSRRATSRVFYLTSKKIQVCKPVFMSTLGITGKRVDYALRVKAIPMTAIATPDRRGKKQPKNKTSAEVEDRIKAHINSFPCARLPRDGDVCSSQNASSHLAPSATSGLSSTHSAGMASSSPSVTSGLSSTHSAGMASSSPSVTSQSQQPPVLSSSNCSKCTTFPTKQKANTKASSSTQLHLPPDLTITKMYQLYQDQCHAENVPAASMWVYTKILHAESKFRTPQARHFHHNHQNHQGSNFMTPASCKCCDRSYAILTSGETPEKIVELLLEEHQSRLGLSSSSSSSHFAAFLSKTNTPQVTLKTSSKIKRVSPSKIKTASSADFT
ncbi:WS0399_0 protein [Elysia marginata]|uniref:WS0399_0 protein n=1 Tax=Elysia marginata TaxID=1093978 RepID=A0AAV4ELN9_9GAST|nr:WS0399_0 protein [Elysia marginata]